MIQTAFVLILSLCGAAHAEVSTSLASLPRTSNSDCFRSILHATVNGVKAPVPQMLEWELTENAPASVGKAEAIELPMVFVPKKRFMIHRHPDLPKSVEKLFVQKELVAWPKHPFNQIKDVPYFENAPNEMMRRHYPLQCR